MKSLQSKYQQDEYLYYMFYYYGTTSRLRIVDIPAESGINTCPLEVVIIMSGLRLRNVTKTWLAFSYYARTNEKKYIIYLTKIINAFITIWYSLASGRSQIWLFFFN